MQPHAQAIKLHIQMRLEEQNEMDGGRGDWAHLADADAGHCSLRKSDGGALVRCRERREARARPHRAVLCSLRQFHFPGGGVC